MTAFAGAVSLRSGRPISSHIAPALLRSLSRDAKDRPQLFQGESFALAHVDLGLLNLPGTWRDDRGQISLMAGEPLLPSIDARASQDIERLHADWSGRQFRSLRGARGTFCIAHVDPAARCVRLAADKLALRPLHYAVVDDLVVFATALRVLLVLVPQLARAGDLTAQAQIATLGHVLGERSPYQAIRTVEGGCAVDIDAQGARRTEYFRWDDVAEAPCEADQFSERLYSTFVDAVRLRLGAQRRVTAHISGGLDSRCVVSVLRQLDTEVHSINFAPAGGADLVLGRQAAQRLGTQHFEFPNGSMDFWERMVTSHRAWHDSLAADQRPLQPARIWTGFAGETVLAPTNLTAQMLTQMRHGDTDAAIAGYLRRQGGELSARLFVRPRRQHMAAAIWDSIRSELSSRTGTDPARRMHVFQLLNEPRGNLARHHEDIDLRRIEFTIPFCDPEMISLALSWQIEPLLRHQFYYRWLHRFPAAVREVAWQAYPWSEPCPVPIPDSLPTQWSDEWFDKESIKAELRQTLAQCDADLAHPSFPGDLLDRGNLRVACMLARLGITRYVYLLRHAQVFTRHARAAGQG